MCVNGVVISDSLQPHGLYPVRLFVHSIFQARILEWGAIFLLQGNLPYPKNRTQVSWIAGRFFTIWATIWAFYSLKKKKNLLADSIIFLKFIADSIMSWFVQVASQPDLYKTAISCLPISVYVDLAPFPNSSLLFFFFFYLKKKCFIGVTINLFSTSVTLFLFCK